MSEWAEMLNTLKRCGVKFHIHWAPAHGGEDAEQRQEVFKQILKKCGFNITPLATNAIVIGDIYYIYSASKPHWTAYEDDPADMKGHKGWGDIKTFLFSWDSKTGEYQARVLYASDGRAVIAEGLVAIERIYGPIPKFTPRAT